MTHSAPENAVKVTLSCWKALIRSPMIKMMPICPKRPSHCRMICARMYQLEWCRSLSSLVLIISVLFSLLILLVFRVCLTLANPLSNRLTVVLLYRKACRKKLYRERSDTTVLNKEIIGNDKCKKVKKFRQFFCPKRAICEQKIIYWPKRPNYQKIVRSGQNWFVTTGPRVHLPNRMKTQIWPFKKRV